METNQFEINQKVTVYTTGEFMGNIIKTEMRLINYGLESYAQYDNVPFVVGTPKRKRSPRKFFETITPYILIVDGWGNPEPDGIYDGGTVLQDNASVKVERAKYGTSDGFGCYGRDFDILINKCIEDGSVTVIKDYRNFKTVNRFSKNG